MDGLLGFHRNRQVVQLIVTRTPQNGLPGAPPIEIAISGDVITIDGEAYDFSELPEGHYVGGIPCPWIVGQVRREGGDIHITVIQTYRPAEPEVPDVEA